MAERSDLENDSKSRQYRSGQYRIEVIKWRICTHRQTMNKQQFFERVHRTCTSIAEKSFFIWTEVRLTAIHSTHEREMHSWINTRLPLKWFDAKCEPLPLIKWSTHIRSQAEKKCKRPIKTYALFRFGSSAAVRASASSQLDESWGKSHFWNWIDVMVLPKFISAAYVTSQDDGTTIIIPVRSVSFIASHIGILHNGTFSAMRYHLCRPTPKSSECAHDRPH